MTATLACDTLKLIMIKRILSQKIISLSKKFPVITITGPRQSGKTTLVKSVFKDYSYISLEDPDEREFAVEGADIRKFRVSGTV